MKATPYGYFTSNNRTSAPTPPCPPPCPPPPKHPKLTPVEPIFDRYVGLCRTAPAPGDLTDVLLPRLADYYRELYLSSKYGEIDSYIRDETLEFGEVCQLCFTAPVRLGMLKLLVNGQKVECSTTIVPITYSGAVEAEDNYFYIAPVVYNPKMRIEII